MLFTSTIDRTFHCIGIHVLRGLAFGWPEYVVIRKIGKFDEACFRYFPRFAKSPQTFDSAWQKPKGCAFSNRSPPSRQTRLNRVIRDWKKKKKFHSWWFTRDLLVLRYRAFRWSLYFQGCIDRSSNAWPPTTNFLFRLVIPRNNSLPR